MSTDKTSFEVVELPEVAWPEEALSGTRSMLCAFATGTFYTTIILVIPLRMTDRATGMWRDPEGVPSGARMRNWKLGFLPFFRVFWAEMTWPQRGSLGCAHAQPEVGFPVIFSGVFYMLCSILRPRSHGVVFLRVHLIP
jgi:hypothetical protein